MNYPEQLIPGNLTNQTDSNSFQNETTDTIISDDAYFSAEAAIAIGYNRSDDLQVKLGVEKRSTQREESSSRTERYTSITRLPAVDNQTSITVANTTSLESGVTKTVSMQQRLDSSCNITVFTVKVHILGFSKQDLSIKTGECHWFVSIASRKIEISNMNEQARRDIGWLDSFNITIGNTRYRSLLHPVFNPGCQVYAYISGRSGEVMPRSCQSNSELRTKFTGFNTVPEHWINTTGPDIYGVAGLVGIDYFDYHKDFYGCAKETCIQLLDFLLDTGIWEIYYIFQKDDTTEEKIGQEAVEYLLGTLVTDAVINSDTAEHCFWYIQSHGGNALGMGYILTSYSYLTDSSITEWELSQMMNDITTEDIWLFIYLSCCHGAAFEDLWENSYNHNNHALVWYYYPEDGTTCQKYEIHCLMNHTNIAQKSCQWMFGPESGHKYYFFDAYRNESIHKIQYEFERLYDDHDPILHMGQQDTMNGYEFCFMPNCQDWLPTCRSRNEPSYEFIQGSNDHEYDYAMHPYMLETWEEDTFNCFVGFYKKVYIPSDANGSTTLHVEFQGRASSMTAASTVTNLRAYVYNATWEDRLAGHAFVNGGTTDTGWQEYSHTFENIPTGGYYNVIICYNDAWSAYRNQHIYVKNIYLGNVQAVTENIQNGDFEAGTLDPWETGYARVRSSSYYVQSGSYGCMLAYYDSQTWIYYQANIEQSLYVSVSDFDRLTFYMRSNSNTVRVTLYYNDDQTQTKDFSTSSSWVKRTIERSDLIAATTIIYIQFERLGTSSCTTAIDTIVLSTR